MGGTGKHYGKRIKADQMGISKLEPDLHKPLAIAGSFKPSEVVAIDKLRDVYGGSRSAMVANIVRHFLELDDDKQRATLIADELFRKKAEALLAKQAAEKEIERLDSDIRRIGCEAKL